MVVKAEGKRDEVFPAHIREEDSKIVIQTVQEHCQETANYARDALCAMGLSKSAYLAGLLHDVGKETWEFRSYLEDAAAGRNVRRGSVNHTFAGVRLVLDHLCTEEMGPMEKVAAQHIAFAIGAHHGVFDILDPEGGNGFDYRRSKKDPVIEEAIDRLRTDCNLSQLRMLLREAGEEMAAVYDKISNKKERDFYAHLISRLLLSAVMEGDRRSAAEFERARRMEPIHGDERLWTECLAYMEGKLKDFVLTSDIQRGRRIFSDRCRTFAEKPGGIYRLNMPTGAGKTLASVRYALAHSKKWGKAHIFFVMPLLAIIDQNGDVLRQYLGREDIILEHHSNLIPNEDGQMLDRRELLMENWDAPVVITTLVQLLNTMFSHKTASIRRFHSLCSSVIIIDEVQTVPAKLLSLFNQTISFLADVCGTTIVLCSATQPALAYAQRPPMPQPEDMIPYDEDLWRIFQRTSIQPMPGMKLEEIAAFAADRMEEKRSLLIICNKKAQAAQLYHLLQGKGSRCFHISASMCMDHRRKVLAEMDTSKKTEKVICISTQVMEAGIDISFQCVIRLMAGMDSIIQAAGRCNRNGESDTPEKVYVIPCIEEGLGKLAEIKAGKEAVRELFAMPMDDYSSLEAIEAYYRIYYREQSAGFQDYYCSPLGKTLYALLSGNKASLCGNSRYFLNQAYKTAGTHFRVFDEDTVDAAVSYGEGKRIIQRLYGCRQRNLEEMDRMLNELKPYTVSLYQYQREALEKTGALTAGPEGILILDSNWYDETLGLVIRQNMAFWEV